LLNAHESVFEWREAPMASTETTEIDRLQYRLRFADVSR
jgi:hypothetical protein